MSSKTDIIHSYIAAAISELFAKEYLLDNLDWDIQGNKYTLRIRGADSRPMVAVGLITWTSAGITLINAVTGKKDSLKVDVESKDSKQDILRSVSDFAEQLREEAAYK